MRFSEIIGQEKVVQKLIASVTESRVSHAQLFLGPGGSGKLSLALAYAQYINCRNRTATDSCGVCPSCVKMQKLTHPDLHFVFPTTTTKKVKKDPESDLFMEEWRSFVLGNQGYTDAQAWYDHLGVENKQGLINVRDASTVMRKLSFKAYEAEYKVMIIWMAEKLNIQAANKMLKLLEEPPEKTLFLLVAEQQDQLLATVVSRTYLVKVPKINDKAILNALCNRYQCREADATNAAMMANGNWPEAIRYFENADDEAYNFHTFQHWMRLCFKASIIEMIDFVDTLKGIGRERQKVLLGYALEIFRNSLLLNNQLTNLVRLPEEEFTFNSKFAPFVNPVNTVQMAALMEEGIRQIERNGNASLIFSDISFKMMKLLRQKAG